VGTASKPPVYTSWRYQICWKVKKLMPRGTKGVCTAPPVRKPVYLKTPRTTMG